MTPPLSQNRGGCITDNKRGVFLFLGGWIHPVIHSHKCPKNGKLKKLLTPPMGVYQTPQFLPERRLHPLCARL